MDLEGRIVPPQKTELVPEKAQWLSGEGGGAWFCIQKEEPNYRIQRFTPEGILDCNRVFSLPKINEPFDENLPFEVAHISHCAVVRVIQQDKNFVFTVIEK